MSIKLTAKQRVDPSDLHLTEKVIHIRRVAKVVAGGRRLSFNAMVVVGNGEGHVGVGLGRAAAVPDAVRKGTAIARKNLVRVTLKGNTVPHSVVSRYGPATVLVKPAPPGTGIIAGGAVRAVMEQAGLKDVITKNLGSRNPINVAKAAMTALMSMRDPQEDEARRKGLATPRPAAEAQTPSPAPAPESAHETRRARPTPEPAPRQREAEPQADAVAPAPEDEGRPTATAEEPVASVTEADAVSPAPEAEDKVTAEEPETAPEEDATAPAEDEAPQDTAQPEPDTRIQEG